MEIQRRVALLRVVALLPALCICLVLTGCFQKRTQKGEGVSNMSQRTTKGQEDEFSSLSLLEVGLRVLQRMDEGSKCISPLSLSEALHLAALGAAGQTQSQLNRIALPQEWHAVDDTTAQPYQLANAAWFDTHITPAPVYQQRVQSFGAQVVSLPIVSAPEQAARRVNSWVSEATHERIQQLVTAADLAASAGIVLTNALYFKDDWRIPFLQEATQEVTFHGSRAKSKVPMMLLPGRKFRYVENALGQLLLLPYSTSGYFMAIFLPAQPTASAVTSPPRGKRTGPQFRMGFPYPSARVLESMLSQAEDSRTIEVHLPRFSTRSRHQLAEPLQHMGITAPFSPYADFSGITREPNSLRIGSIVQVAEIEVAEQGVVASAATGVIMTRSAHLPPRKFVANRPFLYMVCREHLSNALFVGVYDGE